MTTGQGKASVGIIDQDEFYLIDDNTSNFGDDFISNKSGQNNDFMVAEKPDKTVDQVEDEQRETER